MGKTIDQIQQALINKVFRYSRHAIEQRVNRHISNQEVEEAINSGEIIEEYPHDKYGPSCLIYGRTSEKRPLHIQCSLSSPMVIITVYEPDPLQWLDYKIRRIEQ
jgi:hypothetical protein